MFAQLLREVGAVEGIRRVRFTSPHPHDFTPDVIEAMAETPTVCEHIHFPLQSGSDRVLKAMQRSYRRERYLGWLEAIRAAVPGVAVSTDVIVGFPGETEEDFAQTLEVVERARFDSAFMFQYSPRPGTRAASFDDQIPKAVVQERFERLQALAGAREPDGLPGPGGAHARGPRGGRRPARALHPGTRADQPDRAPCRHRSTRGPSSTRG